MDDYNINENGDIVLFLFEFLFWLSKYVRCVYKWLLIVFIL